MPRDSARRSSSGLAGLAGGLVDGGPGGGRVALELPLGPGQVHLQPDQPLLRPVVDVALEPAQRLGLGGDGGVAPSVSRPSSAWVARAGGQQGAAELGLQQGDAAHHERQQDGEHEAERGVEEDPAPGGALQADELEQVLVVRVGRGSGSAQSHAP